ncbi:hypothetical protein QYM36_016012 [Artemia franciscana]|uniref:C2H2-type domain-containing protein n=1 Tax=Artemia franciscana TaxID=6661 RepID=A0AA88L2Y0_ARTSF|nr:hypothetical protein QYM36_016012 [Artemia franciscana]
MRIHTGENPFKCDMCDRRFSRNYNLNTHMRIHTGEKPFKCDVCKRGFSGNSDITRHMRIHTSEKPFKCDICEQGFSQSGNLTTHMKIHTGENPFKCDMCDRRFSRNHDLTRHMRIHTGEKSFKCDICDQRFNALWILDDEVQKSLDILDQVLSEFEDVPSSSESITAFSSPCDDGSEKGDNRTKKEVYFGVSTVERSMLQGHGKDLKDQSVSNSVSKLEKNLERIRLVQQNSVTNTDFLKVSNDDDIKPTTRCDQSQEILDNNNEAIVPKNLLSFWLDREERTKAEFSPTLPKGKEQEQNAKNTPPSKLPKPTNIVKPISKADQFLDSRLPKSKIPVSCDARNTDKLSASKHPSDLQKTKVFKIPAENKGGDRIKLCSNSANEELSNILKPNLREELNDQRFKSLQPKKESMVCDINKTGRSTAIIFQEESKKISEIPLNDSNIEKFGSSPPSKSDICFIQTISSHSIHIVNPTQEKLGNFEFAIHARGELEKSVYAQCLWDMFKNNYWRWMSPEVIVE